MFRPFHKTTTRTSAFIRTSNFSTSLPGLGRGGSGPISLGGKTFTFGEQLQHKQGRESSQKKLSPQPGQFDDAEEEREALQTLSEKLISNERDLSNYGGERGNIRPRSNLRSTALKKKKHKHMDNLNQIQAKEFIVEDINWTNFISSQVTLESKEEEEALKLELTGGDYDRYLSVPASIQNVSKKDNVTNQIESMRILIGQNPSYTLSDKKVFYETLARSLKPLMETKTNP